MYGKTSVLDGNHCYEKWRKVFFYISFKFQTKAVTKKYFKIYAEQINEGPTEKKRKIDKKITLVAIDNTYTFLSISNKGFSHNGAVEF